MSQVDAVETPAQACPALLQGIQQLSFEQYVFRQHSKSP
jgi:hypothetical protein